MQGSERLVCFLLLSVPLSAPTRLQALFSVDSASISWQKPLSDQGLYCAYYDVYIMIIIALCYSNFFTKR